MVNAIYGIVNAGMAHGSYHLKALAIHNGIVAAKLHQISHLYGAMLGVVEPQRHGVFVAKQQVVIMMLNNVRLHYSPARLANRAANARGIK